MPIVDHAKITLHYAPRTRALATMWALEELGLDYRVQMHSVADGTNKTPEFLALNPMGKLPTVVDDGQVCAETGAIFLWLGDRYSVDVLAPSPTSAERGDFLRWLFFAGSVVEPCLGERFFKWDLPAASVAWGSYARMERTLTTAFEAGPWLLGERFTLADVAVGAGVRFGVNFGAIPKEGALGEYVQRLEAREAFQRAYGFEQKATA